MKKPVRITVEFPSTCLTCEEQVKFGEQAYWVVNVGIWHEECAEPSNLRTYIADAEQKKELGLD